MSFSTFRGAPTCYEDRFAQCKRERQPKRPRALKATIAPSSSARDHILEESQKELAAFEEREREFSKKDKQERATELRLPLERPGLHS